MRTYIKSLNFKSRAALLQNSVTYKNQLAAFLDGNTVVSTGNQEAMANFIKTGTLADGQFEKWSLFTRLQEGYFGGGWQAVHDVRGRVSGFQTCNQQ